MRGLKVFDADGNETLTISDRLPKLIGAFPITLAANSTQAILSFPEILNPANFAAICTGHGYAGEIWTEVSVGTVTIKRKLSVSGSAPLVNTTIIVLTL